MNYTMHTQTKHSHSTTIILAEQNSRELIADSEKLELSFSHKIDHLNSTNQLQSYLAELSVDTAGILILDLDFSHENRTEISEKSSLEILQKIQENYPFLAILPIIPENQPALIKLILEIDIYYAIHKPLNLAEICATLERVYNTLPQKTSPSQQNYPILPSHEAPLFHGMIGISSIMQELFDTIEKVAADNYSTVLIRGESGTGKEMVARAIHTQSERKKHNFVPVNCAAIPDDLLESELFGYSKGAFTGATSNKMGRIQFAEKGTLFLDEIGDMKHALQAKLLRVIQEREFEPVGALQAIPVDTRILAATHCDLEALVNEGKFREDLYCRLSVIPLHIPPLRKRTEDIPYLINTFLQKYTKERGRKPFTFSQEALAAIIHYPWRGNVRELENLVQQFTILAAGKRIEHSDLPEKFQDVDIPEDFFYEYDQEQKEQKEKASPLLFQPDEIPETVDWEEGIDFNHLINSFETQLILEAMRQSSGNKKEAARLLNLKRTTLLEKIKKKEIDGLWAK